MGDYSNDRNFSNEQVQMIERMKHLQGLLRILSVSRDASESTLKKEYYEMALKLHPDKCKAPGATEAFKALGNAGFEAEMSPEDIFEMFFGGGIFNPSALNRHRPQFRHHHRPHREQQPREEQLSSIILQLLQILPILVIIFGGLIANFFGEEQAFSIGQRQCIQCPEYGNNLRQVEQRAESDYISMLRTNCNRERNQREGLLWTAKMRGDADMWNKATDTELPHCKKLEGIYR
uniref:J domain-containing protein n=1 Tax=Ditylenchus dipsaci TaxID=166011 RepID=A0A915D5J7_9BILA